MQPESLNKALIWPGNPIKGITYWSITAIFIIIHFFLQLSFGVIADNIRLSFNLDAFHLSILSSAYFVIYVFLQIPAGMLIDRFGTRVLLSSGSLVCFLGCLIFSQSTWLWSAVFGRLLMGMGMAFAFISSLHIAGKWFPIRYIALMVGVTETVALIGSILCSLILAKTIDHISWQQGYFGIAIFMAIFGILCGLILEDSPHPVNHNTHKKINFSKMLNNLKLILSSTSLWLSGIYAGLCYSFATVYAALWGIPFLIKIHNMDNYQATIATTFIYLGLATGTPLITWFFGHQDSLFRRLSMIACPAILLMAFSYILYSPNLSVYIIFTLHFILGFAASTLMLCYTLVSEIAPARARSTGVGFVNTLSLITAPVFQLLIGLILEHRSNYMAITNIEDYPMVDFQIALSIIPASLFIAMLMPLFIKPKLIPDEH